MSLSVHQKLTVIYRIEPGCLGPTGVEFVDEFCTFANQALRKNSADCINWAIIPRYDKSLPEIQYQIQRKNLDQKKAQAFIDLFKKDLTELEELMHEELSLLIDQFFKRA